MRQVIYALTGGDTPPPILDSLLDQFLTTLRYDVEDLIWTANLHGHECGQKLFQTYSRMNDEQRIRLFLNPAGFERILEAHRRGTVERYEGLLTALNEALNDQPITFGFVAADQMKPLMHPATFRLGDTIIVDLGTEACQRLDISSPTLCRDFEPLTTQEYGAVKSKLEAAFTEIEKGSPSLARLIRNYTRVVYVRKADDTFSASEQVDNELGAIRFKNIHKDDFTHADVVDGLIHESTHNFLGSYEYVNFAFLRSDPGSVQTYRPVSPWSMRAIQAPPFVHAVFVYFVMMSYAERRLEEADLGRDERASLLSRRNQYASGFLMPGRLSRYVSELVDVDPRALEAIDWMEEIVSSKATTLRASATYGPTSQRVAA